MDTSPCDQKDGSWTKQISQNALYILGQDLQGTISGIVCFEISFNILEHESIIKGSSPSGLATWASILTEDNVRSGQVSITLRANIAEEPVMPGDIYWDNQRRHWVRLALISSGILDITYRSFSPSYV